MVKRKSSPKKTPNPNVSDKTKRRSIGTRIFTVGAKTFKLKTTTLRSIRRLQNSTKLCIPRLPFSRLIRELLLDMSRKDNRIQVEALLALQEAAEYYLTNLFEDANRCAYHARRVTLFPKDIRLVLDIKGHSDPGYTIH